MVDGSNYWKLTERSLTTCTTSLLSRVSDGCLKICESEKSLQPASDEWMDTDRTRVVLVFVFIPHRTSFFRMNSRGGLFMQMINELCLFNNILLETKSSFSIIHILRCLRKRCLYRDSAWIMAISKFWLWSVDFSCRQLIFADPLRPYLLTNVCCIVRSFSFGSISSTNFHNNFAKSKCSIKI